jgi:hypothetical protein
MKNFEVSPMIDRFGPVVTAADVRAYADEIGMGYQTLTKKLEQFKVQRGLWHLTAAEQLEQTYNQPAVESVVENPENFIPTKDASFVSFGNFSDIKKIVSSRQYYPIFITGLSGNGKTFSVEQACAQLKRELIRVNITIETDEDDLIGGFRLVNGETVWHDGPVIQALNRGAILLLDEIDLASNKILCLQSVLEGKGVFLKKIGKYVKPAAGFNVVATANTKGKGSDDGRFIGTNVLNEAFLERFPVTFEQAYPTPKVETAILKKASESLVRLSTMVVLTKSFPLVVWFTLSVPSASLASVRKQSKCVLLVSMMRLSNLLWNSIPRLMLLSMPLKRKSLNPN